MSESSSITTATLRRQARILVLLDSATKAGLTPMGIIPFHAFAFLSNVLAPVWNMHALDGKILKRKGGPFYPALQKDLDRLVGMGMVLIREVTHVRDTEGKWRLEGRYCMNRQMSAPAVDYLLHLPDEGRFASFATEIAYALSAIGDAELEHALVEDATYSDPGVSANNVLDFEEWARNNPSVNAANSFNLFMPRGTKATPGEKLHLYVRHLRWRMHAG
jgi:hypothetical protein